MSEFKSKHAFGSEANVDAALSKGIIDAYDILFLSEGKIGWIDKDGNKVIPENKKHVVLVDQLPEAGEYDTVYIYNSKFYYWDGANYVSPSGSDCVTGEDVDNKVNSAKSEAIESARAYTDEQMAFASAYTDSRVESAINEHVLKKYEIISVPEGTIVDYRDKEIRVMCPTSVNWTHQSVGNTGNADMYYMGFKAYAPEDAVSFKEGDRGVIIDEMFDFNGDFAGVDAYGRKYSLCWLALASYDKSSDTWTYFGKNSSEERYIGWDYIVEWYNEDGVIVASDCVRINLSNEKCHFSTKPYYVGGMMKEIETKIDEKIAEVDSAYEIIEF